MTHTDLNLAVSDERLAEPNRAARPNRNRGVGFILTLALVLQVAPAFAQAPSPGAQPSPARVVAPQAEATPTFKGVEEIVVTAQKREQLSQDVPIALTAFTSENIKFRGIEDMGDLQMQVPGMGYAADAGGGQQVFIRGVGVDDTSASIEAPIATYIDGVYQTRTFRAPTLGIDLQRVEVLKGPQGTLFGRNATGGAINIILEPPSDELTGAVKMGVGSYGQYLTEGVASGPLIKHILDLRVDAAVSRDDGWIINLVNHKPVNDHLEGDGRVAFSFHPTDTLSVDYDLLFSKIVGGGVPGIDMLLKLETPAVQKSTIGYVVPRSEYIEGNNPWKGKFDSPFDGDMENTQNALTTKWDFASWASIKSITAFQEHSIGKDNYDADGTANDIINFPGRPVDDKFFSQEFNLTGSHQLFNWGNWTWLAGAYYGNERYEDFFPDYTVFNVAETGSAGGREKLNDYSVFGDTTISLPWNFSVFGGVRYTYDKKNLNQTVTLRMGANGPFFNIPGATCDGFKFTDQFHNVSPRYGIGWAPSGSVNFYVKESFGYNAGGHYYNGCSNGYAAETLDTIEGGVKGRWLDGRLTVEAAGYYNVFKNYQIFQVVGVHSMVVNAPKAEMWGGEFAVTAIPLENLTVNLGLSLMHSQYDNFFDSDPANLNLGLMNLSGNQTERAPNHTEQVGLEYDWPVPWGRFLSDPTRRFLDLGALRLRGEWFHTDYIVFRPFGNVGYDGGEDRQNPYSIFNIYATLPTADGKWSLRFFAKNFTNTKYFGYKVGEAWEYLGVGGMPPWFGGDLTYRF